MIGVRGGGQVIHNARAGQLQILALPFAVDLLGGLGPRLSFLLWSLRRLDLRFYVLTFPTTCHTLYFDTDSPPRAGLNRKITKNWKKEGKPYEKSAHTARE